MGLLTADNLVEDLQRTGIRTGDDLIIHTSMRSLGKLEKGAQTVVEALLQTVGPTGHLMAPTFTYSLPMWNCEPFDIENSVSRVGAVPEYIRFRADAVRSFHPTHSVAVIGPDQDEITANHLRATPIGEHSPFARMYQRGAKILMLGTQQDTNSSLHYCEVVSGIDYINIPFSIDQDYELAWFINESGQIEYTKLFELPGCSRGFRSIEPYLRREGILKDVKVGAASCQLLEFAELVPAVDAILQTRPTMMLCEIPSCAICPKRRAHMQHLQAG